jgi:hypothetical protein
MSHTYKKDGFEYPSVTTIISDSVNTAEPLMNWAANMVVEWIQQNCSDANPNTYYTVADGDLDEARKNFRSVSQKALDIGSEVHHAAEMHLKGKEYVLTTKEAKNAFKAFLEFQAKHSMEPIALEETVYGNHWAGTLDYFGLFDGKKYVIDFKTSKGFYMDSMGPQIAAYASLKPEAEGSGILRLDKATGFPFFKDTTKNQGKYLNIFNKMVDLYFTRHPRIAANAGWEVE